MQEDVETQAKAPQRSVRRTLQRNRRLVVLLLVVILVGLGSWAIYSKGYSKGKKDQEAATKKTSTAQVPTQLSALPASGEVTKVSDKEITVTLIGGEARTATVDNSTIVTIKSKPGKLSEVNKGTKAILFTKKVDDKTIATRIIVQ